jgi:N-acetylglucosamine-6-phosphate deacetylase
MATSDSAHTFPGFVDLQVNGYLGVDFSSPALTSDECRSAFRALIERGTALFLPTVITSSENTYKRNLPMLASVMSESEFVNHIPGLHLEGPFLSPEEGAVGAHNPDWIRNPDREYLKRLIEWAGGKVSMLTIAAEREGAATVCGFASNLGIAVSLGHQLAGEVEIRRLADAGARALTHLGNGVPRTLDRHDNPIWAGLAEERLAIMMISDGHHLPRSLIKVMVKCRERGGIVPVSDASPIAGNKPGQYRTLGNNVILEEDGKLWNPEHGYLVGSSATMVECMNHLCSLDLMNREELLHCSTIAPLELIGEEPAAWLGRLPSRVQFGDNFSIVNG